MMSWRGKRLLWRPMCSGYRGGYEENRQAARSGEASIIILARYGRLSAPVA